MYVISYDISDNKRRQKTSQLLESMGERVKESVFECKFPSDKMKVVIKQLSEVIEEEDNIRIYPLCEDCYSKEVGIGKFTKTFISQGFGIF